ncbi:MAG: hypothetical protein WED10_09190 [Brumimicrobium sp.]
MSEQYFNIEYPEGKVYIETRYFAPINNLCQRILSICVFNNGVMHQVEEAWSQEKLDTIKLQWINISKSDFRSIQKKHVLNCEWDELFQKFYSEWKDYFVMRQKAKSLVKSIEKDLNFMEFSVTLDGEYLKHEVYDKRNTLKTVEANLLKQNNPSLVDAFHQAHKKANREYLRGEYIN